MAAIEGIRAARSHGMRSHTVNIICAWIAASMRHGTRVALGAALLATCVAASAADAAGPGRALRVGIPMIPDALDPARDEAAVFQFDTRLEEAVPFTLGLRRLPASISGVVPFGATSLFDATCSAMPSLVSASHGPCPATVKSGSS